MDVQLTWVLILLGLTNGLLLTVLAVVVDHHHTLRNLRLHPMSESYKAEIIKAIKDRDAQTDTWHIAHDGRMRNSTTVVQALVDKLNRIFYPESPPSPQGSKRSDSPDTKH